MNMKSRIAPAAVFAALALSACEGPGLVPYVENPNTVIATARDTGRDSMPLQTGFAAIAYDPDGCQNWIIDDGVEGYSSPRFDPATGLPVCNNHFPPGAVVKDYQTRGAGVSDYVPRPRRN